MIERVTGHLRRLGETDAAVEPANTGLWHRVMLPAYLRPRLEGRLGEVVELATLEFLDSPNQGTTFVPRLIGFETDTERAFFEQFTTVKGVGPKKALRALVEPPPVVARLIADRDAKGLQRLPEIGKRLAETIIAELDGKITGALAEGLMGASGSQIEARPGPTDPVQSDAIATLVALGETRLDAERWIAAARERDPDADAQGLVSAAYQLRALT